MASTLSPHHDAEAAFANSRDIHIHRIPAETRPYLALIRAGSQPRWSFFSTPIPKDRAYDVALNYYANPNSNDIGFTDADIVLAGGLSKFHATKLFLESTGYLERYKGVLLLDDDLELLFNLDDFFNFCEGNQLHLAQASIANTSDSFAFWKITRNHPGLVMRKTNFVEVMGPFFAQDFLKAMLHSFDMSISGWGLDTYWGHQLKDKWKAAIIDQFEMKHKNPPSGTGTWYDYLKRTGINPTEEMRKMFDAIGSDWYDIRPIEFVYRIEQLRKPG